MATVAVVWRCGRFLCDVERVAEMHELGDRADLHLGHDAAAVDLDGFDADIEIRGNLLVQSAADHVIHDFVLARSQVLDEFLDFVDGVALRKKPPVPGQSHFDRCDEFLVRTGSAAILLRPGNGRFRGPHAAGPLSCLARRKRPEI